MSKKFKTVALVGLISDSRVSEPMAALCSHLTGVGIDVIAAPDIAHRLPARAVSENELAEHADLIIAVGGDGTMLHAASLTGGGMVPLLGVNRGRLGFLSDVSPTEMLESLDDIIGGNFTSDSRLQLKAQLTRADGTEISAVALNDIVLQRRDTGRMLDFETRIAGRYVNTHMGDGLIVATPTGSTAYTLSCGGPIMEPQLDAIVVVPICPHTLSDRPIVLSADQDIEVSLLPREDTNAEVSVDGHSLGEFGTEDSLLISRAESRITLIHPPGYDFYEILRSKLHWGRDSRIDYSK
ncbi:MAG: NAD+ kinase [Woeseiaceae bacterium]|jgi:NAD+ kinase